ncbi:hypothetical protein DN752_04030 [Echinicola strongylocentroti]|uniref:Uncharacterized protein n=1 Tax=Echinicola strongylocentroti TaxID=1795355 RepID=A0A2Z4IFB8_9BACT|nr:hypothetical protein [Echinicola strongylocentroti]AWW29377.1 hypothetical protein DN752_04030 [Echinicola strongylocentroti]
MKKPVIIFLLVFISFWGVNAQEQPYCTVDNMALISPINKSKGIKLGEDISKAITAFGQPTSVKDYPFETDGKMGKLYDFRGNKLYVLDGKLDGYEIINSSLLVGKISGITYKVGDTIKSTKEVIKTGPPGGPYQTTYKDTHTFFGYSVTAGSSNSQNQSYSYSIDLVFKHGTVTTDSFASLLFGSNKKLTFISTGSY